MPGCQQGEWQACGSWRPQAAGQVRGRVRPAVVRPIEGWGEPQLAGRSVAVGIAGTGLARAVVEAEVEAEPRTAEAAVQFALAAVPNTAAVPALPRLLLAEMLAAVDSTQDADHAKTSCLHAI